MQWGRDVLRQQCVAIYCGYQQQELRQKGGGACLSSTEIVSRRNGRQRTLRLLMKVVGPVGLEPTPKGLRVQPSRLEDRACNACFQNFKRLQLSTYYMAHTEITQSATQSQPALLMHNLQACLAPGLRQPHAAIDQSLERATEIEQSNSHRARQVLEVLGHL